MSMSKKHEFILPLCRLCLGISALFAAMFDLFLPFFRKVKVSPKGAKSKVDHNIFEK